MAGNWHRRTPSRKRTPRASNRTSLRATNSSSHALCRGEESARRAEQSVKKNVWELFSPFVCAFWIGRGRSRKSALLAQKKENLTQRKWCGCRMPPRPQSDSRPSFLVCFFSFFDGGGVVCTDSAKQEKKKEASQLTLFRQLRSSNLVWAHLSGWCFDPFPKLLLLLCGSCCCC